MIENTSILSSFQTSIFHVILTNGSTTFVVESGIVNFMPNISLSYVLYLPKLPFNFPFPSQLTIPIIMVFSFKKKKIIVCFLRSFDKEDFSRDMNLVGCTCLMKKFLNQYCFYLHSISIRLLFRSSLLSVFEKKLCPILNYISISKCNSC